MLGGLRHIRQIIKFIAFSAPPLLMFILDSSVVRNSITALRILVQAAPKVWYITVCRINAERKKCVPSGKGIQQIVLKCGLVLFHWSLHRLNADLAYNDYEPRSFLVAFLLPFSCRQILPGCGTGVLQYIPRVLSVLDIFANQRALWLSSTCFVVGMISTSVKLLLMFTGDIELYRCLRWEFFRQWRMRWQSKGRLLRTELSSVAKSLRISKGFRGVTTISKQFLVHYVQEKKSK